MGLAIRAYIMHIHTKPVTCTVHIEAFVCAQLNRIIQGANITEFDEFFIKQPLGEHSYRSVMRINEGFTRAGFSNSSFLCG